MAIIARLIIHTHGPEDHARLHRAVEARFAANGGPPDGMLVHLGYPDGEHLVVTEAWRTQALFRAYLDDVLLPAVNDAGFTATDPELNPAWSIAIP